MKLKDKVAVITGGGNGIGAAMARRFARDGARALVLADLDGDAARRVAGEIGPVATGVQVDVSREDQVAALVQDTIARHGCIDLFASNAGVSISKGLETTDAEWELAWSVNLMAHVYAARAVVPHMLERGEGYLLQTASAAGLLSISDASYAVTKHGAVAFAEWLSITYGNRGIKVSCFCPMGVRTNMLLNSVGEVDQQTLLQGAVAPEDAADAIAAGLDEERFLILTHLEVLEYIRRKTGDYDRWLRGMRRYQNR
ncbi:SDR family oxidoreductase [Caldimonas thermodepolymerans]|uniref:Short-chain dehydrogenase n=1 Tax=Caldimonas thermodepolymerans TaxID=215580 RepID=A0A2S5T593_9BURK|nr:SDR family oxidoreductase [Caldimonas thermodepolymerans]PPE70151.1 short-chain dehydrogenase [Caldimonas thermodepolymerans]QPC32145.1 SDR family oxidoreductase [Caldimonas thermodepolymerans]RDH98031.1 NADP-dependent 3-hydroxy acid dehydrogenase YdfG [Caldimonas thermodepolymerans]